MNHHTLKRLWKYVALITVFLMLSSSLTVFAGEPDPDGDRAAPEKSEQKMPERGPSKLTFTLKAPRVEMESGPEGSDLVKMEGFGAFGLPGEPLLPHKVYQFALPPEADLDSLQVEITDIQTETLEGTYDLTLAVPDTTTAGESAAMESDPAEENQQHNWVTLLPSGQMRKWKFARLRFDPVSYDLESGEVTVATQVKIRFSYDMPSEAADAALLADSVMDDAAMDLFDNYGDAKDWYLMGGDVPAGGGQTILAVITTNAIVANSTKLDDFLIHKTANRGIKTILVTEDDYGGLVSVPTDFHENEDALCIRQWLINNYISESISDVLLIGDPDPDDPTTPADTIGDLPMLMTFPRYGLSYEESPTDYFYADLTGDWDYDDDRIFGEFYDDYNDPPSGGVDLSPEVYVGRIPVYGTDYASLDDILQKIMDYEMEENPTWRITSLLPMSFSEAGYDGAPLAEQMMDDFLDSEGYSSWTMYQQGNGACGPNSIYPSNEELLGGTVVRDRWVANDYGVVTWWGHGSATEAAVGYGGCWDGTLMDDSYAPALDDDHPSFVFMNSCLNGYPENSSNLGYAVLENGGIGTISASRVSWYNAGVGYGDFDGSTTNSGIAYEFTKRIADYGYRAGLAIYNAKSSMTPLTNTRLMNYYDFNLYGDPTTSILDKAPPKVVINEVFVGAPDKVELYNYGSTAVNLSNWHFRAYDTGSTPLMTEFTLPTFTLPAGGYVILDESSGINTSTHLYFNDNIDWIGNEDGAAKLYDDDWFGVDFVRWDLDDTFPPYGTGWMGPNPPPPPTNTGPQLSRFPNGVDTNYGSDWRLQALTMGKTNHSPIADFIGDGYTDISVFRPSNGNWYVKGMSPVNWALAGDLPVPGDYDGDGDIDIAVYRPSNGNWYVKGQGITSWGFIGDIPMQADYDGDGLDEVAVLRPSNGRWYIQGMGNFSWHQTGDIPVPCDYDGDGAVNLAVLRPSNGKWYIKGMGNFSWYQTGDIPVPADYDGNGTCDIAVYRPSNGNWYVKYQGMTSWGFPDDIPVPGDYNADGAAEIAVLRPSNGRWYIQGIGNFSWYFPGDYPLPVRDTNADGDVYD